MSSRWPFLPPRPDSIRHRLIFALDVETFAEAERLVQLLAKDVGVFKVGKQLFLHSGPEVVRMIHRYGVDVFLDLKFHDIPHTVARAARGAGRSEAHHDARGGDAARRRLPRARAADP